MKVILLVISIIISITVAFSFDAYGVPPGRKKVWKGGGAGKVTFDSKDHKIRGGSCIKCHPDIFIMKGNAKITMADIYDNRYCGACHNGVKSFDSKIQENCTRCHK
jgi:c(7)-type cytochrome triheme protein